MCSELGRGEELGKYYQRWLKVALTGAWADLLEAKTEGLEPLWAALFDHLLSTWFAEVTFSPAQETFFRSSPWLPGEMV